MAEKSAKLVFGCDRGHRGARLGELRENRRGTQVLGVVHHHLEPGVGVEEEVARDAVYCRGTSRHDGQVVGIGEAGNDALSYPIGTLFGDFGHPGHGAGDNGLRNVVGLAAVHADHHHGDVWPAVVRLIDFYGLVQGTSVVCPSNNPDLEHKTNDVLCSST